MPAWFSPVYAAVLHVTAIVALVVLMATSHLSTTDGMPLLAGLLGFAAGLPVSPSSPPSDPHSLP